MSPNESFPPEMRGHGLEESDLDGHTIEELSDYLDADRTPAVPSIDNSPGCELALDAMTRLQALSSTLLESDAAVTPAPSDDWINRVLGNIALEAHAGRRIPFPHPSPRADLAITEGAVRGVIRAAELDVEGVIIGRCRLEGDVTRPGEAITVRVDASVVHGAAIPSTADALRQAVGTRLAQHTLLSIASIDIVIRELHAPLAPPASELP